MDEKGGREGERLIFRWSILKGARSSHEKQFKSNTMVQHVVGVETSKVTTSV